MSENPQANPSTPEANPPPRRSASSFFFPLLLILAGVVLLLSTTGMLPRIAWWRLWVLWPALLVLIGIDILLRRAPALLRLLAAVVVVALLFGAAYVLVLQPGQEAAPLHTDVALEDIRSGDVQLDLGAGQLTVESLGDTPNWAEIDLTGTTREPTVTRLDGSAGLEISQENWSGPWPNGGPEVRWLVQLNPRVPVNILAHLGVGECTLDLGRLSVQELTVSSGVGECTVTLPGRGEAGTVRAKINNGVGSLHVIVPEGVAAQLKLNPGLGGVSVDEHRFPKVGDGLYRTADYEGASYRLDVQVDVGVGSIEVK